MQNTDFSRRTMKVHNKYINHIIDSLKKDGYKISADHIENQNKLPREVNGFKPDIIAEKNNEEIIIEVEICGALLFKDHLKIKRFSSDKRRFILVVPPECLNLAETRKRMFHYNMEIRCIKPFKEFKID